MKDILDLKKKISRKFFLPHQVAVAGWEIFMVSLIGESVVAKEIDEITNKFVTNAIESGFEDICEIQANYATNIINSGQMLDEERFKILSLCDEISALEKIGMRFSDEHKERFRDSMSKHFIAERKIYKNLAMARLNEFNGSFWHYKLILQLPELRK